jgi:hypothetical protein
MEKARVKLNEKKGNSNCPTRAKSQKPVPKG